MVMVIGGVQKFSLSDYPGKPAAVLFVRGCNFRCPWCHNPGLVDPVGYTPAIAWEEILDFLKKRRDFLQGVVISGGEPTLHQDLGALIKIIKELGYSIKLDSNGSNPEIIEKLLNNNWIDCLAIDYKVRPQQYLSLLASKNLDKSLNKTFIERSKEKSDETVAEGVSKEDPLIDRVLKSISLALGDPRGYIRTTLVPGVHFGEGASGFHLEEMQQVLRQQGFKVWPRTKKWQLQEFRFGPCLDPRFSLDLEKQLRE
jgi:pyruvate formate lyase activating enzyme